MKAKRTLTALLLAFMWAFAAQADEALITGKIRVGAYDVEVQNASRTNWVDGDLVIIYLNTNATVTKSFTLPQATTGRLLAVGGGGAGGQDQKQGYSASYGLPGGGGAGGLVIKDAQAFDAKTYKVSVGAGGAAVARSLATIDKTKTWVPASYGTGANGGDSTVKQGTTAIVTATGGGGGGRRSVGNAGGSGGGGSYSGGSKNGGTETSGQGNAGGKGGHAKFGAGGGGAGGAGGNTTAATVDGSGAGGAGKPSDITGEMLEYARGGAGGVPRLWTHYWDDANGVRHYFTISTSSGKTTYTYAKAGDKVGSNKYFWCEASDGKPGRDGYGDGGGGSGHYSSNPTFAGRGGNGAVIVRIPPYKTTVEDALKTAFAEQPATVSGSTVTLTGDITGPIDIPDNLGAVTINLNGHAIIGADGADGDDITPGGDGQPALKIVPHEYDCESSVTILNVSGAGSLKGGNGGKGYPGGAGAAAVSADGFAVNVADGISVTAGTAGESYVQHPHKWAYTVKDNKIVAYCVAEDGEPCSYRDQSRGPFVAVSAADAAYTAMRYDELTAVNGITPVTGIVVAPETYVGRDGTDYPESATPPREQGAYTVNMKLGDLRITSDFTITEPKPSQGSVYQAWKTAERKGRDVQIVLSATFDGSKAINDGNVLFLGSRCSAHSMAGGTVESSVNAMTRYASVRWYAYGSSDPANNLVNQWTKKGEKVAADTVALIGANHFVHKEMMDDLYAELVEKKNRDDGYDLIILEFDGDLLCREGFAPYQLNYRLPEGWTDEKAARLRAAMSRYYAEDRVVWIVPDVNQPKSDAGYTGEYPWTSNPEFIWQRAFLNATETEGYKCPLQKNYEKTDELVAYLQEVLVGHFFSNAIIKDTLAEGLTIKKVTPQMRSDGGIWLNFEGTAPHYTIPEPRSGTTVTADVERVERQVTVTFDMKAEQAWACEHNQVIGDDFRVVIDAELDGFFSVGDGEWQETNEGPATFTFTESNLDDDEDDFTIVIEKDSPKIQNVKLTPDYTAEDVVRIYDGKGTNIVVKPIAPTPDEAVIRYSLDEHGTYVDNFALTNVCDKTKVWFEITDKNGEFNTVTNFATVTILPRVVVEQAEDASKPYDGTALTQPAHSNVLSQAIIEAEKMYPGRGASAAGFVPGEGFANVPMTSDSQQTEVGSHANTIDKTAVTVNEKTDKNNYVFIYLPGVLIVTPGTFTASASPALKVYDGIPTNITVTVTGVPDGVTPVLTYSYSETEGFVPASDFTGPTNVSESATVYCRVTVPGCGEKTVSADVTILRRYVVEQAGSASKPFDNTPLVCGDHGERPAEELKDALAAYKDLYGEELAASATGFVGADAFASVPMTGDSTITNPGVVSNTVDSAAVTFTPSYDPDNYSVRYLQGELKVTAATFTASAEPVEKFYDSTPTNIIVTVSGIPSGVTPTYEYSYSETEGYVPAADFTGPTNVSETAEIWCRVIIPGTTNVVSAVATIKPRIVVSHAKDGEWTFNGAEHKQPDYYEDEDAEAEKSKEKWGTDEPLPDSTGFVEGEGYAADLVMTDASRITNPGTKPNVIDQTADKVALAANTKAGNYELYYLDGELKVTAATFTASAEPVEKFYDSTPTNIIVMVSGIPSGVTPTYEYSYSETEGYVPASDFTGPTNVSESAEVYCRVIIPGTTNVVSAVATIKPRIVVSHAKDGEWTFNGAEHKQPDYYEDEDAEAEKSKEKWGTDEPLPDSTGFVEGEGYAADLVMTDASRITNPGTKPNVIDQTADKVALAANTKAGNYELYYLDGTLTVTAATMGIEAFDAEKFYDAEPTNITWVVTNATGGVISDAVIFLREKNTDTWIPVADFVPYVDTTNIIVEVKAEKSGFDPVEAEATVLVKPRPVTLVAGSAEKVYDGLPLTTNGFTVATDTVMPGYGFVKDEGVECVTMTDDSTVTLPGTADNVIASETAKPNTKLDRNYIISTEPGTLTVTAAAMGIEAFPVEKFYDAEPTNITWVVTNAAGVAITDATISLREKNTTDWIPVADFVQYVDTTNVTVQVRAEKSGFDDCFAEATVLVKPRPVTLIAGSAEKVFDGTPLTCDDFEEKDDETTAAIPGYGFVDGEGVASVTMTGDSTITLPGSQPNVIATTVAEDGTKLDRNYIVTTELGTLTVTPAAFTASATPYDEFYDGQEHTIEVEVQKPEGAGEATITYAYEEGGTYLPIAEFEQLKDVTAGGPVTVYAKVEVEGYSTVVVSSTVNIKPRIVVEQAESASKIFDGTPLVQPNHHEEPDVEAEKSKAEWGTDEVLANSTGFVAGEGFAGVPMTAGSTITEPGVTDNVIDVAAVTLLEGTKAGNYIFYYLPGELAIIQRQEEVRRDPEVVIPEESKKVVEESDKKIAEILNELVKDDPKAGEEPYIKYQLTVTPTNNLSEVTRTTPEKAAEDAKEQIELFEEAMPDAKVDKVEFVDIVLERTYSKEEAEATAAGDYNKDNWESLDKAEEHGNRILEVTIPVEVPEGMELVGVTRSCDSRGTEILLPKDPDDPNAEGFIYDPATKTVTLYAKEFCVFGFMMETESPALRPDGDEDLCLCKTKTRIYEGTIIGAGLGVIGRVVAIVSRPNKNGVSSVKAKVISRFRKSGLCFSAKAVFGDCVCAETEVPMTIDCCCNGRSEHHDLVLRFDGDTMTGWFDGDGRVDGGIDVFKIGGDPRRRAIDERVGSWNGVFAVNEVDGTSGLGILTMTIRKSGAVSIRCRMPNGGVNSIATKYQVGEDGVGIVPVVYRKGLSDNKVRGFGFRLVFRPGEASPRAYDVSPEQAYSVARGTLTNLGSIGDIEASRTESVPLVVTRTTVQGASGLAAEPEEVKIKVSRKTNALSGQVIWKATGGNGKGTKVVGKVKSGVVVNGVGYGMLSVKGMGAVPFTCTCE